MNPQLVRFSVVLSLLSACKPEPSGPTTESASEATAGTDSGTTTTTGSAPTTTESSASSTVGQVGTTFPLEPGPCPEAMETCVPLGDADSCPSVEEELWEKLVAECDGGLAELSRHSRDGQCCLVTRCVGDEVKGKACVPLAAAKHCVLLGSLPDVDLLPLCESMPHAESDLFVEGDNCCQDFECYCGATGG